MKSIDIIGLGAISVAGLDLKENWNSLLRGESKIHPIMGFPVEGLGSSNAGQIYLSDDQLRLRLSHKVKSHKRLPIERGELLLFHAFEEALVDSGLSREELSSKRVAILVGTSLSGFTLLEKEFQEYKAGKEYMRPSAYLSYPLNSCIDRLAYEYELSGPRYLFSTACSASLHPIMVARELFNRDEIDIAIIGGTDPISLLSLAGFSSLKALSKDKCSPFTQNDLGISIGEGAGILLLAKDVNSSKYSSILNVSGSSDAYHPTASNPTGEAIRNCIEKSLNGFNFSNNDLYVLSHGTGTPSNDKVETRAIRQVEALNGAPISAIKSVLGHTLGASGALELVLLTKALNKKKTIPIANFGELRAGCDLNYVRKSNTLKNPVGIKSAFAFGGNNVSVLLGPKELNKDSLNHKSSDEIVITGIGMSTPIDKYSLNDIKTSLMEGRSFIDNIDPVEGFNRNISVEKAGLVNESLLESQCIKLRIKNTRKMDRITRLSTVASALALKDSGLRVTGTNSNSIGLISATGTGALKSVYDYYSSVIDKGVKSAEANIFPNTVVNAHLGYVSIELKIKGYTTVIAQGSSSPYAALNIAKCLLESGQCSAILVGSVSEYSEAYHKALIDIGFVKPEDGQHSYSKDIKGNISGEGAVFFLLEKKKDALARGAKIYSILDRIAFDASPCFPSTYAMKSNPLSGIFSTMKKHGIKPSYYAGDGNGLKEDVELEYSALKENYPGLAVTSAAPYFGMAYGVIPFYNMAMFSLLANENKIIGVPHSKESSFSTLLRGVNDSHDLNSVLVGTVSPGGCAGSIFLRKNI